MQDSWPTRRRCMSQSSNACPYLIAVVADRLWVHPVSAYCRHPDGKIRVPSSTTMMDVCTTSAHTACGGYIAARTEEAFLSSITA
jgi:hypothetical protein